MSQNPYQISGKTKLINASTTTGSQLTQVCTGGEQGMFLSNPSSQPIYIAVGQTSAVTSATQPTTTTPSFGLCLAAGRDRALWVPPGGWLDAVSSAGSMPLYATPGFGL